MLQEVLPGQKALLVASTGGHLMELLRISEGLALSIDSMWVTFDTPQSRSLLAGQRVHFVPYVPPRGLREAGRAAASVQRLLRLESFDVSISTGAALAVSGLPLTAARGIPSLFVESLARPHSPSVTGRILRWWPRIRTYTQYAAWRSSSWRYSGSILDDYAVTFDRPVQPRRILVTMGTIRPYAFTRAVEAVCRILEPEDHVQWQLGSTPASALPGTVSSDLTYDSLDKLMRDADVVVTHAGVGTILQALSLGKVPVLAVREATHGEHVDDHQRDFAEYVTSRGLGTILDLRNPQRNALDWAASHTVARRTPPKL